MDPKPNFNEQNPLYGEEQINKCLQDKKIGFEEISMNTAGDVFRRAQKSDTFRVPNENLKVIYKNHASSIGRKDLNFVVEDLK